MAGVNKVFLIGHLGGDPEIRYTQSGQAVCNFNMATSESYKNKEGVKVENTEWHKIVVWGKLAEICGEYLQKGKQVYIEGKLQTRQWEDRDGNKRSTTEIVAFQMVMLGGGKRDAEERQGQDRGSDQSRGQSDDRPWSERKYDPESGPQEPVDDDQIPF